MFFVAKQELLRHVTLGAALVAGVIGVLGLAAGSALLVVESRTALRILKEETDFMVHRTTKQGV